MSAEPAHDDTKDEPSKLKKPILGKFGQWINKREDVRRDSKSKKGLFGIKKTVEVGDAGRASLLCTDELESAIESCKAKVSRIARDCRHDNVRFTDIAFDVDSSRREALDVVFSDTPEPYSPSGTARVKEIFDKPQFFTDGARANDLQQGRLGDCWFISAIGTVCGIPHLIERLCVARDEMVGVYGFIFFRDGRWESVIVDDRLYLTSPRYELLDDSDKARYFQDRNVYNKMRRTGSRALYFASCSDQNETWLPLLEKAFAKFHGNYESISGGFSGEGIEDLTGGVTTSYELNEILDYDRFWRDELMEAGKSKLFSCSVDEGSIPTDRRGLIPRHAYSVLKVAEVKGKRFLWCRNPWGERGEWDGAWSDGAKEWTPEWMAALDAKFGDDGEFIMEYSDFIKVWSTIERVRLFDETWSVAMETLNVKTAPFPFAASFGDVSFEFTLSKSSAAVIVLSKLDSRFFSGLEGSERFAMEFRVFKKGSEDDYVVRSRKSGFLDRSVNVELDLEAGEYIVHVRLDARRYRQPNYLENVWGDSDKLVAAWGRMLAAGAKASNFDATEVEAAQRSWVAPPSTIYAGASISTMLARSIVAGEEELVDKDEVAADPQPTVTRSQKEKSQKQSEPVNEASDSPSEANGKGEETSKDAGSDDKADGKTGAVADNSAPDASPEDEGKDDTEDEDEDNKDEEKDEDEGEGGGEEKDEEKDEDKDDDEEPGDIDLILRVYSHDPDAKVTGETRHDLEKAIKSGKLDPKKIVGHPKEAEKAAAAAADRATEAGEKKKPIPREDEKDARETGKDAGEDGKDAPENGKDAGEDGEDVREDGKARSE